MKPDSVGAREAIKGVDVVSMPSHAGPEASAKFVAAGDAESLRLEEDAARAKNWKRWGPYLSERQWGTVREDYSDEGSCWSYFSHDHARSRAYRWGEDGLLGITDRECRLCFSIALWNGKDPFLKERLFGLTGPEGNHGEDVKEVYHYLDAVPTSSYLKALYRYPQAEFPYQKLLDENQKRGRDRAEFEIADTGVFAENRFFDIIAEYAKSGPDDILIRVTVTNHGPEAAVLHVLPTLWFRNTWSWGGDYEGDWPKPTLVAKGPHAVVANHVTLGKYQLNAKPLAGSAVPEIIFTENETNGGRLFGTASASPYVKDAFHSYIIDGNLASVNPAKSGTKAAIHYRLELAAGAAATIDLRLASEAEGSEDPFSETYQAVFDHRRSEAEIFYRSRLPQELAPVEANVCRQAYAGLLWSKQFYHYVVSEWLAGDPKQPLPSDKRKSGRNADWPHIFNRDVISMPDKWEYPWYAAWDLAFHMIPMAKIDPQFAKEQLLLLLREWYMHPSGQIPAYEFALGDVNPPVHAWACWRVYKMTGRRGRRDRVFLARVFQKLLINFTWWVNRKDVGGKHIFSGGFLGLDNIGVFDRSQPLPTGGTLEQSDGTAWMAFYCATMLAIALELAIDDPAYEDVASKFFEHFVAIAEAMNTLGGTGLWDEQDGFYYDQLHLDGESHPLRIRSMVGIIPLFTAELIDDAVLNRLPGFKKRLQWFLKYRKSFAPHFMQASECSTYSDSPRLLLAIPSKERLAKVLKVVLDEKEFLSPFGIRSLSRFHEEHPFKLVVKNKEYKVAYLPGESDSAIFGGNSNWRGPIWFPVNFLLIEALERYHYYYGETLKVECPTGSGQMMNLKKVAEELTRRLTNIFLPGADGARPFQGDKLSYPPGSNDKEPLLFHEYFHGDTGKGLGASHQTGWTALVASCLEDRARHQS
ncbi:MAG: glucosidase [Planctomycetota bacterium]|nr:glucosidase [Planctomycetota bacterium]